MVRIAIHHVVMDAQKNLQGRLRPLAEAQRLAQRHQAGTALGIDGSLAGQVELFAGPAQGGKRVLELGGHMRQARGVVASRGDLDPIHHQIGHDGRLRGKGIQIGGEALHVRSPPLLRVPDRTGTLSIIQKIPKKVNSAQWRDRDSLEWEGRKWEEPGV